MQNTSTVEYNEYHKNTTKSTGCHQMGWIFILQYGPVRTICAPCQYVMQFLKQFTKIQTFLFTVIVKIPPDKYCSFMQYYWHVLVSKNYYTKYSITMEMSVAKWKYQNEALTAFRYFSWGTYTVGHKKTCHFYFYDSFGKCGPISIILSLLDS